VATRSPSDEPGDRRGAVSRAVGSPWVWVAASLLLAATAFVVLTGRAVPLYLVALDALVLAAMAIDLLRGRGSRPGGAGEDAPRDPPE
jgi:hypothetical protein